MTSPSPQPQIGLLLVNLGTPEAPTPEALKPYLNEFLMDPEVIDIPAVFRWPLVHWIIVPRRASESAALYRKIWTDDGSPLLVYSRRFASALRASLADRPDVRIELGMRYGRPSIADALRSLSAPELDRLIVFPLYPQYAQSSTLTARNKVQEALKDMPAHPQPEWIDPFYGDDRYIAAVAEASDESFRAFEPEFSLFSFHGVPERHLKKLHPVCLSRADCCDRIGDDNRHCYRAQCFQTARSIAEAMEIEPARYGISFQSRLGRTPWIQPFTDFVIQELPGRGIRRVAVFCPSFVADCLETLDEIENRERERFLAAGGEDLRLIPSLNDHPAWVRAADGIVRDALER